MKRTDPMLSLIAKAKEKADLGSKTPTDQQIDRAIRELFRDKDFYPVHWIYEDGKKKTACNACLDQRGGESDGLIALPRGITVACDCCGIQIAETPVMRLNH